ncbi:hypothetical protein G7Y89_g902 [Cudoniella acicularis]|uniref:Pisatin demethylase n=1 Tax=Cudoniella acicularis TaxID=354080 RepID=A0A8H4RZ57_9HELO|nr:hypothetical protein G7Y89_g902 [Cudoniella acicularis]
MTTLYSFIEYLYTARYQILLLVVGPIIWQQWRSYRRLSHFKGPSFAAFSNLWMSSAIATNKQYLELYRVCQKYGELARIGPNLLLTSDPDLIQRRQKIEVGRDNMFSTIDENLHTHRRAQMAIGYSGKEIDGLEAMVDKHILSFVDLIRKKYITVDSDLKPLDIAIRAGFFTMDVITDIAFGQTWGCLSKDEDVGEWFATQELVMPITIQVSTLPWLASLLRIPFIAQFIMPSEKDKTGAGRLLRIVKEVVEKRSNSGGYENQRDMMASFFRHGLSKSEAVTEAGLQIIAGADTTATAIRATLLFVITNPPVYRKLQAEIDATQINNPVITDEQAKTLPYLQAVLKEGLRMWPITTAVLPKVTPPNGDTFKGRYIPGGTEIGLCWWGLQRNKEIYGEDSAVFRPERWLRASGQKLENMERTAALAFGYGRYQCLGKNIAQLELNKVFFELLRNFEFTLIDPTVISNLHQAHLKMVYKTTSHPTTDSKMPQFPHIPHADASPDTVRAYFTNILHGYQGIHETQAREIASRWKYGKGADILYYDARTFQGIFGAEVGFLLYGYMRGDMKAAAASSSTSSLTTVAKCSSLGKARSGFEDAWTEIKKVGEGVVGKFSGRITCGKFFSARLSNGIHILAP